MNETLFKDIGIYKSKILTSFIQNTEILDCLLGKNYTNEQIDNIVYSQIFPYLYVDGTQSDTLAYICVEIDISRSNNTIKDSKLIIWIYAHKDKKTMKYSKKGYYGTRVDILTDMVDTQVRGMDLGVGKPSLRSCMTFTPENNYYGRVLMYNISDFKIKDR